ncbi:MAG: Zn-binding domain-containing protein [Rhizomicrobium sp.]
MNALLLSHWFADAEGELLKMKAGSFFGYPDNLSVDPPELSPVKEFCAWLATPSVRACMAKPLGTLVHGTRLADGRLLCTAAADMFENAREAFGRQWDALRSEAQLAPSDQARNSLLLQLKRLCGENLLKELANRALLPAHGFPTAVIPFINDTRETRRRTGRDGGEGVESAAMRRYDYPSRNADIALREYAPGAEVVIDGLVWRSAGVTLNWQRPAHEEAVREIQSLRHFWQCRECGAADCSRLRAERCVVCDSPAVDDRRFLEPAGFRVDWDAACHANTDVVTFIESEPVRVSARGADWEPLLDPALGRGRANANGLVFFANSGTRHRGYRICLECGRAEEEPEDGGNPLAEHTPLRGARAGSGRFCPGGSRAFAITEPIALGYEVQTDVAEIQPAHLPEFGGAWALVSALREALTRRLGIESGELGMAVESRRGVLGQNTHSLFLFDRNAGGAGFAGRLFDDLPALLDNARTILSCTAPGCERGCSACILTADLFAQQRVVDRKAALAGVERILDGMRVPQPKDAAVPHAQFSPPAADAIVRCMAPTDRVTLFASEPFDVAALSDEPFISLFATARTRGAGLRLALRHPTISGFNAAQRLGLRDAALRSDFTLWFAEPPVAANGAVLIAMHESKAGTSAWFTRDGQAAAISGTWGIGQNAPVVYGTMNSAVRLEPVDPQLLLPKTASSVGVIREDKGRSLCRFGAWFAELVRELLEPLGLWHPGALQVIRYSDRYLRSPLSVALTLRALAGLRDALMGKGAQLPLKIDSSPLDNRKSQTPSLLFHDWQRASDREAVIARLSGAFAFDPEIALSGAQHARELEIGYRSGQVVRLYLDQGFGYWQIAGRELFDFAASPARQAKRLEEAAPIVAGSGTTYLAVAGAD